MVMKRNRLAPLIVLFLMGLTIYAGFLIRDVIVLQDQIADENVSETLDGRPHIIMIGEVEDHLYWNIVRDSAMEYADANHLYLQYKGPRDPNPDEQVNILRKAIDVKPDGLIVQSLNESFIPLINEAITKGIPVITVDSDQPDSDRITYVGTDNYAAGERVAEDVLDHVDVVQAGIIAGTYTNNHHQLRLEGFHDVLQASDRADILDMASSGIKRVNAREKAYQMLLTYPEMNVLYGTSALDVLGITEAIDLLGREGIYVVGFDTIEENLQLLGEGKVDTLVSQEPYQMGIKSMEIIERIIRGETVPDLINTDSHLVKRDLP